jgi:hypothetical protein
MTYHSASNCCKPVRARCFVTLVTLVLALFFATSARAQVAGATLSGNVTDKSGAAIPNASVTIRNTQTGQVRSLVSNSDGFFSAPNLNPGTYEVKTSATGFSNLLQKAIVLTVGGETTYNPSLAAGGIQETVTVTDVPPSVESSTSTLSATVDGRTVRELPLNGRDWTSLATLQPGVVSVPNQATTGFSANKGNRGFGNQLSDSGHRPNENTYRVNGMVINDYTNAAPGGATGVNLGVDSIDQFSVLTANQSAEYGRTSGAVIDAITKIGTNSVHGSAYFFDRDSIFDAKNAFDSPTARIPPFRRIQFGGAAGFPIFKDKLFGFFDYEGIRQSQSQSGTNNVPDAAARAAAVPAIQPYLALWPVAPAGSPDTIVTGNIGFQTYNTAIPTRASENYYIARVDDHISAKDSLDGTFFYDSGPQTQADPLGNAVHQVFSSRQLYTAEETHIFNSSLVNTVRGGVSRVVGLINAPVSGDAVATNPALAIAPGAAAPPEIPVPGLTTAYGLGGFNRFNHAWNSFQFYDDAFITQGAHSIKVGVAFERMQYNILEKVSPNGRMNTYRSLSAFLNNAPTQLNAVAPTGSHEVGLRESLYAVYFQDDWKMSKKLVLNLGLRYEGTTKPGNSSKLPAYTVNGYTVASAPFQIITTLQNCQASPTACGPVGVDTEFASNPTKFDFQPRLGFAYDPFGNARTAIRGSAGIFDVLPLPYEFGLNNAASAPFQIVGADPAATLGTGSTDANVSFNPQTVRNRYIEQHPQRAAVYNWNVNVQQEFGRGFTLTAAYVGSRSTHLSVTADDINLTPAQLISGVGIVLPCNPSVGTCSSGTTTPRIDSNWGGGSGIRPAVYDGAATYQAFQGQLKVRAKNALEGQFSYTYGHCNDLSSAPVTGDTYLTSIAVPLLTEKSARLGPCDFDIQQVAIGNVIWTISAPNFENRFATFITHGWELGGIVTAQSGSPFTVTFGGGNDPLGTGFNGDYSMDFADLLPNCTPTGGRNYIHANCFTPPTAPSSLAPATATNPYGCAPTNYPNYTGPAAPSGRQFCSNVVGNTHRNEFFGPHLTNLDASLFKNTRVPRISDALVIQFRAEFFNILNHPNYLSPGFLNTFGQNNSVYDSNGSSLSTALNQTSSTSRQIQLGLKINF